MRFRPSKLGRPAKVTLLLALLAAAAWTYRAAILDILRIGWGREEQSHIMLAPLIALWLLWLRRSRLRALRYAPNLWGPLTILLAWAIHSFGLECNVQVAWHLAPLVALLGCVVSFTGITPLRAVAPAVVAMLFFIPVPGSVEHVIALPLQAMATTVTQMMLELIGVPVTRLGHVLLINGQQVAVGEACNGMRMVFALALIVYAFAFSTPLRNSVRAVLFSLSPLVALICNIIRLIPTTLVFGYGTAEQAEYFHTVTGWVMLPIAILMLVSVLRMIRWVELPVMVFRLAMP